MDTGIRSLRNVLRNGSCSDWPLAMTFSLFFKQADGDEHTTAPPAIGALKGGRRPRSGIHGGLQSFVHHRDRTLGYSASIAARSSAVWPIDASPPGREPRRFPAGRGLTSAPTAVDIRRR